MKILYAIPSVSPRTGGVRETGLGLPRHLLRLGHDVEVVTTHIDGMGRACAGVRDVPLNKPVQEAGAIVTYYKAQYPRWGFSLDFARAIGGKVKKADIVHVYSLYQFTTFITIFFCKRHKTPYVFHVHGSLDPVAQKRSRLAKSIYHFMIEKRHLNGAAAIHYNTSEEMRLAEESLNIRAPGVVVPCGIDLDVFSNLPEPGLMRAKYPQLQNKKILLFLGRINPKKGLDLLAKAFAGITQCRNDVALVIAGPDDGGYQEVIRKILIKSGVLERVVFTGMLFGQEKLAALRDSDLFVLPSYSENFGIAVVEAMASGLPVVISRKVNTWEEFSRAGAAEAVNCDAAELETALLRLLNNPARCKELAQKGMALARRSYAWESVAKQMATVYEDILARAL